MNFNFLFLLKVVNEINRIFDNFRDVLEKEIK
jgi:hypothetical protein